MNILFKQKNNCARIEQLQFCQYGLYCQQG